MPKAVKQKATKKKVRNNTKTPKLKGGIAEKIKPVSYERGGIKVNIYGKSGSGKTTLACTFPKPLLLIGAEDGTKSIHNVEGVYFVPLEASVEIASICDLVLTNGEFATVVLDTATSFQDLVLKEILGLEKLPEQRSWGMASRDQYGQCSLQTKEYIRSLLNLAPKVNVVILAQERAFNVDEEASELIAPSVMSSLTPSVVGWLNPNVDYICHTYLKEKTKELKTKIGGKERITHQKQKGAEYCLRTGPDATYTTKFRSPKGSPLPDTIVDPDYDKIERIISGE